MAHEELTTRTFRVRRFPVDRLESEDGKTWPNPILEREWPVNRAFRGVHESITAAQIVGAYEKRPHDVSEEEQVLHEMVRGGPRERVTCDPAQAIAAVVTCGGLCPGLNTVVREIVMCLHYTYGVQKVYGVRSGYRGFGQPLIELDPERVVDVHNMGGTILGSSRGGFDLDVILGTVAARGITQLYIVGGDGTHRGAGVIAKGAKDRGMRLAVAVVPKTIDNDIPLVGQSFGFETAVAEALKAIQSARVEAIAAPNGVGLVKLMGRHAGFIALHATLAARNVGLCVIPEMDIDMDRVLAYIRDRVTRRGHIVVVVAEGVQPDGIGTDDVDASGNKQLVDVGLYFKRRITEFFKEHGDECNVKYVDPTYMIRSVPANPADSFFCARLAHNAVHGVFGGFTGAPPRGRNYCRTSHCSGFTVGTLDGHKVLIPIQEVCSGDPVRVRYDGPMFSRMCLATGQPAVCRTQPCVDDA